MDYFNGLFHLEEVQIFQRDASTNNESIYQSVLAEAGLKWNDLVAIETGCF